MTSLPSRCIGEYLLLHRGNGVWHVEYIALRESSHFLASGHDCGIFRAREDLARGCQRYCILAVHSRVCPVAPYCFHPDEYSEPPGWTGYGRTHR